MNTFNPNEIDKEMYELLNNEHKEIFDELKESIGCFDINISELIIKWVSKKSLLTTYIEKKDSIDGVEDLVLKLTGFVHTNCLIHVYNTNVEIQVTNTNLAAFKFIPVDSKTDNIDNN